MEFDTRIPIYLQIIKKIKEDIVLGTLKRGEKLPSVRNMASQLKVNVNTIQRVYQELEREGITFTQRGKGSFITEEEKKIYEIRVHMGSELLKEFLEGMKSLGYSNEEIIKCLNEYIEEEENGDIKS
ncbi:GntR family transcriptional regulator [Clostridiisalibacter paucivorans]|uniref:GntR family transcriptional regulator n=1 Tax=Clostridiisalibacter paucivorans TaxID=408753 RepID=UPI00047DFB63|nr:GntR family transcriptional regulator [Clostridiisalibacter paucivorans]